jgi:PadR family transcriptional regulator, regulatory protein PadR
MSKLRQADIDQLLSAWEETYKKGQLTHWIFLALKEGEKYVDEIRTFVVERSKATMRCEEQSLYRVLRKFEHVDIVSHVLRKGNKGPDRKYYRLTPLGVSLFSRFVDRNINLFFQPDIKKILLS